MAKANSTLNKITTRAKRIRSANKKMPWIDAVKKASRQLKSEGKIGTAKPSTRQTGSSNKKRDRIKKAKPPGKRIVKHPGGKNTVYYERRKNRSDKPGQLTGMPSNMYAVRDGIERDIKNQLVLIEKTKVATGMTKQGKKISLNIQKGYLAALRRRLREQNTHINKLLR